MDVHTPGEALLKSQTHPQMCCCHPVMKEEPRQETDPPPHCSRRSTPATKGSHVYNKPSSKHTDTCTAKTGPPGLEET